MGKAFITFFVTFATEILITCCAKIEVGLLVGIPLIGGLIVCFLQKNKYYTIQG